MGAVASQITSLTILYSTVYSDADQRKMARNAENVSIESIKTTPMEDVSTRVLEKITWRHRVFANCRRVWRRALSYRQLPTASVVTELVVRYLAVFNVVSNFYYWCYYYFYHCTTRFISSCSSWLSNDTCYILWFYSLRVFMQNALSKMTK